MLLRPDESFCVSIHKASMMPNARTYRAAHPSVLSIFKRCFGIETIEWRWASKYKAQDRPQEEGPDSSHITDETYGPARYTRYNEK